MAEHIPTTPSPDPVLCALCVQYLLRHDQMMRMAASLESLGDVVGPRL